MKRVISVAMLLCVVTILLSAMSLKTAEARVVQNRLSPNSCGSWSVVPSPNPNNTSGLSGVAVVSARDIWAVGGSGSQMGGGQTLIEHWNGTQWQIVQSPSPGSRYNTLYSVTAVSTNDVWAVGYYVNTNTTLSLTEHWNGTQWSVVKSPSPASVNNELYSVVAISSSDVWTVGLLSTSSTEEPLIEHWNGKQWSVVKNPNPGASNNFLSGVSADSANDVWAVGAKHTLGQTLVEHWNGKQWSIVKSPSPGSSDELRAVTVVSASDAWAVGYTLNGSSIQNLVENWNGTSWQVVKSSNIGSSPSFNGVAAVSANDVWAVGSDNGNNNFGQTLTEQWNGKHWSVVNSPSPGSTSTQLLGVAVVSANDVWTVGHADSNTLIENYHC